MAEKWKESSIRTIKVTQTLVARAENNIDDAKTRDTLPSLRDKCVWETNRKIHNYARSARSIVVKLRQTMVAVNDEIKSLNRVKENLYRVLNANRKHLSINLRCLHLRKQRPIREKELPDTADGFLLEENSQLLAHKEQTESQLHTVLSHLQVLGRVRMNLSVTLQERSKVTDLLCHSISSTQRTKFSSGQALRTKHVKSLSAPPITQQGVLSPETLTPAVSNALSDAEKAVTESQKIKSDSILLVEDLHKQQSQLRDMVDEHIVQRIAQTATLAQHLEVNGGEAKMSIQGTLKHLNDQEKILGYSMGPVSTREVTVREKLDRPLVKVYQSHPGTDLPEAAHLISASNIMNESIAITQRNIALLKLARRKIKEDVRDKKIALNVDSTILRFRKREGHHRMLLQGTAITLQALASQ